MENVVRTIAIEKLVAHPDNPNRQSKVNFDKLVRNIERTGKYEPLIVRRLSEKKGVFSAYQRPSQVQGPRTARA